MTTRKQTHKQAERQRFRDRGRYSQVNPCYACGKSAGVDYFSHPMTDQTDANGQNWGDIALCLCMACLRATEHMTTVEEFKVFLAVRESRVAKRKCEAHKVSQGRCRRIAVVGRQTSGGTVVALCRQCDERFGSVVGAAILMGRGDAE